MAEFELPSNTHRTIVIGKTGSGKTVLSAWLLSLAPFHKQPYIVIDFKGDKLLQSIPFAREIDVGDVPKHSGVYITRPLPGDDLRLEALFWNAWKRERVGIYCDELYNLPHPSKAVQTVLRQGRSKRVPIIGATQRPAWVAREFFTEAEFFACFHLTDPDDHARIRGMVPNDEIWDMRHRLPKYHARWYDQSQDWSAILEPAEPEDQILARFETRLKPKRKVL